jgi:adenine phosphoribosyltransferase
MTTRPLDAAVRQALRAIPDYPKPGITFQDITPILRDKVLFRQVVEGLAEPFLSSNVNLVLGIEARGFILGAPVALQLGAGFVPARKPGKLPWKALRHEYALEYGTDALEVHEDAFLNGGRVLIVDDVLATGGTAAAAAELVHGLNGTLVGWSFLLELGFLPGRSKLEKGRATAITTL